MRFLTMSIQPPLNKLALAATALISPKARQNEACGYYRGNANRTAAPDRHG
jgi:hypothetical protein